MKIIVDSEQLRYFRMHHFIQFDDVVPQVQLEEINREVGKALAMRTGARQAIARTLPPAEVFPYTKDLWRESERLKRFECQNRFADLIQSLFDRQKFILGSDQLIVPETGEAPYYSSVFAGDLPFEGALSIQGMHALMLVGLEGDGEGEEIPFPAGPGSVTILSPECVIDWTALVQRKQRFLLISYATPDAVYTYCDRDPNTHVWKSRGYVFGDKLIKKGHPPVRL